VKGTANLKDTELANGQQECVLSCCRQPVELQDALTMLPSVTTHKWNK